MDAGQKKCDRCGLAIERCSTLFIDQGPWDWFKGGWLPGVRVLLVDDYEPWRCCVWSILSKYHLCESIREVADG
jgi:hypothetical protein